MLEDHKGAWQRELVERLNETDDTLDQLRSNRRADDQQVIADLEHEQRMLEIALDRLLGVEPEPGEPAPGVNVLQLSWVSGRLVAWLGGPDAPPTSAEHLHASLQATRAPEDVWATRAPVPLPNGDKALAFEAATADVLGWLLGVGAEAEPDELGPSVHWLALVAAWAVELVARGAMVPTLRRARTGRKNQNRSSFGVAWNPALIDAEHLKTVADTMPGAVAALSPSVDGPTMTRSVLAEVVDVICHSAAKQVEVPAAPDDPRTPAATAEAFLARLDGRPFEVRHRHGRRAHQRPRALGRAGHGQGLPGPRRPARPARLRRRLAPRRCSPRARATSWCPSRSPSSTPATSVASSRGTSCASSGSTRRCSDPAACAAARSCSARSRPGTS